MIMVPPGPKFYDSSLALGQDITQSTAGPRSVHSCAVGVQCKCKWRLPVAPIQVQLVSVALHGGWEISPAACSAPILADMRIGPVSEHRMRKSDETGAGA